MCFIILCAGEGLSGQLSDPGAASEAQAKYTHLLQRYLKKKYRGADASSAVSATLCGGVYIPIMAQEAIDIKEDRLPVLDDADIQDLLQ